MAIIQGLRVKNFGVLQDVSLGRLRYQQKKRPLTPMTAIIGRNGVGKSTFFDVFGFLADALQQGVEAACDSNSRSGESRGGFEKIRSKGQQGPIEFEIYYKQDGNARPITYEVFIAADKTSRPYVLRERLHQRRKGQKRGQPFSFVVLENGQGIAWKGQDDGIDEEVDTFNLPQFMAGVKGNQEESKIGEFNS